MNTKRYSYMEENVNQTEKEMAENEKQNQTGKEVAENEKQNQTGKEVAENANLEQTETIRGLTTCNSSPISRSFILREKSD